MGVIRPIDVLLPIHSEIQDGLGLLSNMIITLSTRLQQSSIKKREVIQAYIYIPVYIINDPSKHKMAYNGSKKPVPVPDDK